MTRAERLEADIGDRRALVGVVGLGYVGLPLALAFAEHGFGVLGFDIDTKKIESLQRSESYLRHLPSERLLGVRERLEVTTDYERLREPDAILICVPTPLTRHREPDLRFVLDTAEALGDRLRAGQLVVLESTTYPGTTDELLQPVLEDRSGLTCGTDFFLAFSPEREDPGNPDWGTSDIPKVVGGVDETSGRLAELLYGAVVARTVRTSDSRVAEATKLLENIFRAVNIALVNELKIVYSAMGIDVWEVIEAASTKPFGFMRFDPGPGWGGHCIPLDPFYLAWKAREYGVTPRFIELAGEVNIATRRYVIDVLRDALDARGKAVRGSRILILGLAYKRDIDDPRESPAFSLWDTLHRLGAEVVYHDPHVPVAPRMRSWPDLPAAESVRLDEEILLSVDAVLLVTDHAAVDYELVVRKAPLVVDTRGMLPVAAPNVVRA